MQLASAWQLWVSVVHSSISVSLEQIPRISNYFHDTYKSNCWAWHKLKTGQEGFIYQHKWLHHRCSPYDKYRRMIPWYWCSLHQHGSCPCSLNIPLYLKIHKTDIKDLLYRFTVVQKTRPGICFDSFEEEKLRIQIIQSSRQYSLVILLSLFTLLNIEMHSI